MSHRNEMARARHRGLLKQDHTSLASFPFDDGKGRELTLKNHFGWTTLQKCQVGDGSIPSYPQVVQYYERPEIFGPDYRKVTHVMFLKGKPDSLGKVEKEVQAGSRTTFSPDVKIIEQPEKPAKAHKEDKKKKKSKDKGKKKEDDEDHRKKLVDEFYYHKSSPSGDRIFRPIEAEEAKLPEKNPVVVENYTTDYVPDKKKPKAGKGRGKPKSWQLRADAGAEEGSDGFLVHHIREYKESVESVELGKGAIHPLQRATGGCPFGYEWMSPRSKANEVLWDSQKNNEYLYVPKPRGKKQTKDRS